MGAVPKPVLICANHPRAMACVRVKVLDRAGMPVYTHALLDTCSTATLMSKHFAKVCNFKSTPTLFHCSSLGALEGQSIHSSQTQSFDVTGTDLQSACYFTRIRHAFVVDKIPASTLNVFTKKHAQAYEHLKDLPLTESTSPDIEVLIGIDNPSVFWSLETRTGEWNQPYGQRGPLGWFVLGQTPCHDSSDNDQGQHLNCNDNAVLFLQEQKSDPSLQLSELCRRDFEDIAIFQAKPCMSIHDKESAELIKNSMKLVDGKFQVDLPFKLPPPPDLASKTRIMARRRALSLLKRFKHDHHLRDEYCAFMQSHIDKGQIRKVSNTDPEGQCYLPHHAVYHPRKKKIRVVFDPSAYFNPLLHSGPDLINSLAGVLSRFRREPIAFVSDIEGMYVNCFVPPEQRHFLRLFWFDENWSIVEYEASVHLFGIVSSSPVANSCVRAIPQYCQVSPRAEQSITDALYVDDLLDSVRHVQDALDLVPELQKSFQSVGLNLHSWLSNSRDVMAAIAPGDRHADHTVSLDLDAAHAYTLGMIWNFRADTLYFDFTKFKPLLELEETVHCRRSVLSSVASIYDPLGLISPITVVMKKLLQSTCKSKLGWDDPLPPDIESTALNWLKELPQLSGFSVPRCLQPPDLGDPQSVELHAFCDASKFAYAVAIYLVVRGSYGTSVNLIHGKSRVAPLSPQNQTIFRLELTAAALLIRLLLSGKGELRLDIDSVYYWTDSSAVLSCINSPHSRFNVFVSNRIGLILTHSLAEQWRHVPSELNPSDVGSRGITPSEISKLRFWTQGPDFLHEADQEKWPKIFDPVKESSIPDVALLIPDHNVMLCTFDSEFLHNLFNRWSSLDKLKRTIAWARRFVHFIASKRGKPTPCTGALTVDELQVAEHVLFQLVQIDVGLVASNKSCPSIKTSNLKPFLVEGTLRVGGRIRHSHLPFEIKHPIILPKRHPVTTLVIRHFHLEYGHCGPLTLRSKLRNAGIWIIDALSACSSFYQRCVPCMREEVKPLTQQMADLPPERVRVSFPFEAIGIDLIGPMWVKAGRRRVKRWILIAVCCATRAVHLEIVFDSSTDAFINALCRLIARRGKPNDAFSDNARNFLGAEVDLGVAEKFESEINAFAVRKGIRWRFHPPKASSHAGHYERLIRSTRKALRGFSLEPGYHPVSTELSEDNLSTFLCQVEAILNDRPISPSPTHAGDEDALTPSQILLLKPNPCEKLEVRENLCKSYHQAQEAADIFWDQWSRNYLTELQKRQKCIAPTRNLQCGDLVLMAGENLPRRSWPLARVVRVIVDDDQLVRKVELQTKGGLKLRPVNKLCLLEGIN